MEGAAKMDSGALFAMIFGSEKFEPLVGTYVLVCESAYVIVRESTYVLVCELHSFSLSLSQANCS